MCGGDAVGEREMVNGAWCCLLVLYDPRSM